MDKVLFMIRVTFTCTLFRFIKNYSIHVLINDLVGENTEQDAVPTICCQKEVAGIPES